MPDPLLSICIPTYNGEDHIEDVLACILNQRHESVEVVISDDQSQDSTYSILKRLESEYSNLRLSQNEQNLGMDANFSKTAEMARGKYIWFFGQDDLLKDNSIDKVITILEHDDDIGIVYVNFSQHDHDFEKVLNSSYLETQLLNQRDKSLLSTDSVYRTPQEYFEHFENLPTFLPATIMKRSYWSRDEMKQFAGTAYSQVGLMLLNMRRGSVYVIAEPLIRGRIPDDQWQSDGQKHYDILTGSLQMLTIVYRHPDNPMPKNIYRLHRRRYLLNYFFLVYLGKRIGLTPKGPQVETLRYIFRNGPIVGFYLKPILFMPKFLMAMINAPFYIIKKSGLKLLKLLRIHV